MTDDPFDDRADPYAQPVVTRRAALVVLAASPTVLGACALQRVNCVTPGKVTEGSCRHRFCRHHTGGST